VALPILARNGARATTLSQIAKEAGVSTAGLLHHFASKEQLMHAVLDTRDSSFDAHADFVGDVEVQLRRVAGRFDRAPGLVGMFTVLLAENLDPQAPLHERFLRRYRDSCAIIGSGIKRGQRAGRFRGDIDPRVKAKEVVAFLYGIETSWLLDPAVPVAGVFAEYTRSLVTALQPFPPNAPPDSAASGQLPAVLGASPSHAASERHHRRRRRAGGVRPDLHAASRRHGRPRDQGREPPRR
jgi:AcrR family transcriptional regulator